MAAARQKQIALILQKRATLISQITALMAAVDQQTDLTQLKLRLTRVTTIFHVYEDLHDELAVLDPEIDGLDEIDGIRDRFYRVAAQIDDLQNAQIQPPPGGVVNAVAVGVEKQKLLKLPTAELPEFNGDHTKWLSFYNTFKSMIDSRTELDDVSKFLLLKKCMRDEAARKIAQFDPSSENYKAAWDLLKNTYDRKRILVSKHIDAILELATPVQDNPTSLSRLIDNARQHLSALKSLELNPEPQFVIRILEKALPPSVRRRWEETLTLDALPTLEQLYKFINETVYQMHSLKIDSAREKPESNNKKRSSKNRDWQTVKVRKNERGERTLVTSTLTCGYCSEVHPTYKCSKFEGLSVVQRWDAVKTKSLCRNCLNKHAGACTSSRCKQCNQFHHTLLHHQNKQHFKKTRNTGESVTKPANKTST